MLKEEDKDRRRIAELELQQAQYDASLAERRYAACDPDNRLIAAQLEKAWEAALHRVEACRQRLDGMDAAKPDEPCPQLAGLADDLSSAWQAPQTGKCVGHLKRSSSRRLRHRQNLLFCRYKTLI